MIFNTNFIGMIKTYLCFMLMFFVVQNVAMGLTNCKDSSSRKDYCGAGKYAEPLHNGDCRSCDEDPDDKFITYEGGVPISWGMKKGQVEEYEPWEEDVGGDKYDWRTTYIPKEYRLCEGIGDNDGGPAGGDWYEICGRPFVGGITDCREKNIKSEVHYKASSNHKKCEQGDDTYKNCKEYQYYEYEEVKYSYADKQNYDDDWFTDPAQIIVYKKIGVDSCKPCEDLPENEYCDNTSRKNFKLLTEPGRRGVKECSDGYVADDNHMGCHKKPINFQKMPDLQTNQTQQVVTTPNVGSIKPVQINMNCDKGMFWNSVSKKCVSCKAIVVAHGYLYSNRFYCPGFDTLKEKGQNYDLNKPLTQIMKCPQFMWPNENFDNCECKWGSPDGNGGCKNIKLYADDLKYGTLGPDVSQNKQCWTKQTKTAYRKCMGAE